VSVFEIAGRRIADDTAPYVVAELGHNHGGSVETARELIRTAAACGAHAVKFQKRHNQTLYSPAMLQQPYENENSFGPTYGEHRAWLEFGSKAYQACQCEALKYHVACFATAFDEPSADFLAQLQVPAIKLASGSLTDEPLIRHVASLQIPMLLSTGGGDASDIDRAVQWMAAAHDRFALLHCTAAYPVTDYRELNLRCILTLKARYPDTVIGYSDHSVGIAMSLVAYAFGARILERHFTLNRAGKGTDHSFSLEPVGLRKLCRDLDRAREAMGDGLNRFYPSEVAPLSKMRRWDIHGKWQIGTKEEQEPKVRA